MQTLPSNRPPPAAGARPAPSRPPERVQQRSSARRAATVFEPIDPKAKLSALWIFVLLNMIYRDLHQIPLKSELEMMLTGVYNGVVVTEPLMLLGAFMIEAPIAMALFSLLLARRFGRPVTFAAAAFMTVSFALNPPSDMDDMFFLLVEVAALACIVWTAWAWPINDVQKA